MLLNLVSNALKHSTRGTVTIAVSAKLAPSPAKPTLCFAVIDTGAGIRAEDLPKLFHLYQVLDSPSATMHSAGTSLYIIL